MRPFRLLLVLVLAGFVAAVASAQGNDPTTYIKPVPGGGGDPTCAEVPTAVCLSSNSQANPLVLPPGDNSVTDFIWDEPTDLSTVYVEFQFVPGEFYNCSSPIFVDCGTLEPAATIGDPLNQYNAIEFEFTNPTDTCADGGTGICTDVLYEADVSPELGTLALFGTGFVAFAGLMLKKRRFPELNT